MAMIHRDREEIDLAAPFFHGVLLHARHAPEKTPRDLVRRLVQHSLQMLSELSHESGGRIAILPEQLARPPLPEGTKKPVRAVLVKSEIDLADEESSKELVDWILTGKPPVMNRPAAPPPPRVNPKAAARNALCPCGSGRKYKHCCLRG
jgi:hypothetical protein